MDESALGNRDKRGFWRPNKKLNYGPVLVWPFKVWVFLKWLFGYPGFIFPWNAGYVAITVIAWFYLTPSIETMSTLSIDWMALVFLRNVALTIIIVSAWYFFLYMKKTQNTEFKIIKDGRKIRKALFLCLKVKHWIAFFGLLQVVFLFGHYMKL